MSENKIIKDDIISFANSFDLYNQIKNKSILIQEKITMNIHDNTKFEKNQLI